MVGNSNDAASGLAVDASGTAPGQEQRDRQLALSLGLPLWRATGSRPGLLIGYDGPVLELKQPPPARTGAIMVDFASAALKWRLQGADLLLKAIRGRSRGPLQIIDATAGLGRDSFSLAARGHQVLMIERSPVVAALLANGLQRGLADADPVVVEACRRLRLRCGDAQHELQQVVSHRHQPADGQLQSRSLQGQAPQSSPAECDVVYLDPMFPERGGHALAKKEMQVLQRLLNAPDKDVELLAAARARAKLRVVVKRPRKSPPLAGQSPHYQLSGRAIRFDVYVS